LAIWPGATVVVTAGSSNVPLLCGFVQVALTDVETDDLLETSSSASIVDEPDLPVVVIEWSHTFVRAERSEGIDTILTCVSVATGSEVLSV
jgi:hypothetical protein